MLTIHTQAISSWATSSTNAGLAQAYGTVNTAGAQYNALAHNAEHNQAALAHAAQVNTSRTSVSFGEGAPVLPVTVHGTAPESLLKAGAMPTDVVESTPSLAWSAAGPVVSGELALAPGVLQAPSTGKLPGASLNPVTPPSVVVGHLAVGPGPNQEGPALQAPSLLSASQAVAQLVGVQTYGAQTIDSGAALVSSGQVVGLGGNGG